MMGDDIENKEQNWEIQIKTVHGSLKRNDEDDEYCSIKPDNCLVLLG